MAPHSSTPARKIPWMEELEGCSPWGRWGSDTTERLHFHFSLWCVGEGNGNPLQCSCLENPRDVGAWWAAVSGVAQSRTRLKWLSSSSSDRAWPFLSLVPHVPWPHGPWASVPSSSHLVSSLVTTMKSVCLLTSLVALLTPTLKSKHLLLFIQLLSH